MGVFFEHPIGFLTAFNPPDVSPGRRFACGSDAGGCESRGVRDAKMPGLVHDVHRNIVRNRVQIRARRRALFFQLGLVIAEAHDQSRFFHCGFVAGNPGFQGVLQAGDVRDLAIRRRQQVGRQGLQSTQDHVAMAVDESRQQRLTVQVVYRRFIATVVGQIVGGADGQDQTVLDGNGLGTRGFIVDGNDRSAQIERIGQFLRRRATCRKREQAQHECPVAIPPMG